MLTSLAAARRNLHGFAGTCLATVADFLVLIFGFEFQRVLISCWNSSPMFVFFILATKVSLLKLDQSSTTVLSIETFRKVLNF